MNIRSLDEKRLELGPVESANSQEPLEDAVRRSLLSLTGGHINDFTMCEIPSLQMQRWVRKANLNQLNGLLISALLRWHRLQREEAIET